MVRSVYELREIFKLIWNDPDSHDAFGDAKITDDAWWNANCVANFLEPAAPIIELESSSTNATISISLSCTNFLFRIVRISWKTV